MATPEQVAQLRLEIAEPDNVAPYADEFLSALIDEASSVNSAARVVWRGKAATAAHLVDISEGGSSRKMSDVYKNFLAMSGEYKDETPIEPVGTARPARTRAIRRA